jgi:hypothetical protein
MDWQDLRMDTVDGVLINPFDILETPSCRIKETAVRQLLGLEEPAC